jgi:ParB family chromosome partitioning protein
MDPGAGAVTSEKGVARPVLAHDKRRALGRGLESLLPGPRPSGGGAAGSGPAGASGAAPSGGAAAAAASAGAAGAVGVASAAVAPIGPTASGAGVSGAPIDEAPVPGVIAELQGQAARRQVDGHEVMDIAIELIDKNPHQTRRFMDDGIDALMELSDSIKVQGVLQPITVRPGKDGRYILVAGERRMRASKMAERKTIPAIVRVVSEQQAAELTIIENLQREDLNCMELALAYALLSKHFNLTQEQIGERVGVARETVSNYMRLARLPDSVQRHLAMRRLEFSHARVLLNLQDSDVIARVADKAERENWSVDKLEKFVLFDPSMKDVKKNVPKASGGARWVDPNVRAAQRDLERILGLRVRIRDRNGKGKITLEYSTLEDLDRVVGMLKGKG